MADGTIRVGTKLDTSGIKADIKELNKELASVEKEIDKLNQKEQKVKDSFAVEREIDSQVDEKYQHKDYIDKQEADALAGIKSQQEELNAKKQEYISLLEQANAKLQEQSAISQASKELETAAKGDAFAAKITSQEQYNSLLEEIEAKMASIEAHAERIAEANGVSKDDLLAANPTYRKLSDQMGILTSRTYEFKNASTEAGEATKASMRKAKAETNGFGVAIQGAIKRVAKMTLAVFGIRGAYRAVRMALTEYLSTNEQLAGQIETMKSLFAQVLGPAIEWVVNLLIKAVSAVNAFVYALTGINLVAKANASALQKQAKAADGGNQTAGFDEQTKLSGGAGQSGSGAATLPDGTTMDLSFLDPLKEALQKFMGDIAPFLNTIKELGVWLVDNLLIPLGEWAANGLIPAFLNILGGAFLALNDALLFIQPVAQWLWDNFLAPIASWTGGVIVDVLNAIGDWIHEHHETLGKLVGIVGALVAVLWGVPTVLGLITGAMGLIFSPITLIVAAVAGLIALFVTLYDECEGFKKGMDKVWKGIKDIFFAGVDFVKALFKGDWAGMDKAWAKIKESAASLWEGLVEGLKAGWNWCAKKVTAIWNKLVTAFKDFFGIHSPSTVFSNFGKYMMDGLVNGIKNAITKVTSACKKILSAIKSVFSSVGSWFKETFSNAWQKVKDVFSSGGKIFSGIKEGIESTFKSIVNKLIGGINTIIATPFNAINKMLNTIRSTKIMGFEPFKNLWSYNPLSVPEIPKLALGGIVNRPGRGVPAIIGEAGAEAVLPLENNTEWMDILADKIGGGNVTIPIYLDGKKIYTYMVDIGKRKAFAANGG
jgi:hypothetical protein